MAQPQQTPQGHDVTVRPHPRIQPLSYAEQEALTEAMTFPFTIQVTGFLLDAYATGDRCNGIVYRHRLADASGVFADGNRIITSPVQHCYWNGGYWIVETLNSQYVIVTRNPEIGNRSLLLLVMMLSPLVHRASPTLH